MEDFFIKKVEEIKSLNCMTLTNKGPRYGVGTEIFNIRGTRIYLLVKKTYYYSFSIFSQALNFDSPNYNGYTLTWRYKIKNKKEYKDISFEEVLDHKLISNKAKTEIVFNLNVFLAQVQNNQTNNPL